MLRQFASATEGEPRIQIKERLGEGGDVAVRILPRIRGVFDDEGPDGELAPGLRESVAFRIGDVRLRQKGRPSDFPLLKAHAIAGFRHGEHGVVIQGQLVNSGQGVIPGFARGGIEGAAGELFIYPGAPRLAEGRAGVRCRGSGAEA